MSVAEQRAKIASARFTQNKQSFGPVYLYDNRWASMLQVGSALGNRAAEEGHIGRQVGVLRRTSTLTWTAHVYSDST